VNYPGLAQSKFNSRVRKLFGGRAGGLLTFGLGDKTRAFRFIDSLKLAKNLANLGDAKTLVIHPASTIFHEFTDEAKEKMSVSEDMVRVSVGIEDFADIKDDFEQAIQRSSEDVK
jgi:O-acetylhomoserine (thiol)-lyase